VPLNSSSLDDLDAEIEREAEIFRGRRTPASPPAGSRRLGATELVLGGAAVGILLIMLLFALDEWAMQKKRPRRR
jgi:hypothetical protein